MENFVLSDIYSVINKVDLKLSTILIETSVLIWLIYLLLLPITKEINKVYLDSKLIRKLYFKKNKKSDDPL